MATNTKAIEILANSLSIAIEALGAASQASATLKQAQDEGWTDDDPRWAGKFAELDTALTAAKARLD